MNNSSLFELWKQLKSSGKNESRIINFEAQKKTVAIASIFLVKSQYALFDKKLFIQSFDPFCWSAKLQFNCAQFFSSNHICWFNWNIFISHFFFRHLLGRFCYEVAELSWWERKMASTLFADPPNATMDEAKEHFMAAEQVNKRCMKVQIEKG